MAAGIRIWNELGQLVFDSDDRVAGGIVEFSTGQVSGSYTATPDTGQSVEFVYLMPGTWIPAGTASRWPGFSRNGNTLSWSFNTNVAQGDRNAVSIMSVYY